MEETLTPEMEDQARASVIEYLNTNQLPIEALNKFNSKATPKPDFSYLYTGGGRCIEFIVNCYNGACKQVSKYPYDEHGEECP